MKRKLLTAVLLIAGSVLSAQVSIGIRIGPPPPPRIVRALPSRPGPDYVWIEGYWYPVGGRYRWHDGYWTRPVYPRAHWIAPRYDGGRYFEGFWEGDRGKMAHDHRWDRGRDRDYHRDRDHDRH
jgi:hypothetical protein